MASQRDSDLELLQEKWRFWFHWLDIDNDNCLTAADWTMGAETMIKEHQLEGDSAEIARVSFQRIGKLLLGHNLTDQPSVNEDQFVDNLTSFYSEDRIKASEYVFNVIRQLFLVADVNRDGLISQNEFSIIMKSFGMTPERATRFYQEFKNHRNSKVPMQEVINWWVDVWFGTDREQWAMVKTIYE